MTAKVANHPLTCIQFQKRLDTLLGDHGKFMVNFGKLFIEADEVLSGPENRAFLKYARQRGMSAADINAAVAVAKGEIDGRLFYAGVASSKILLMSKEDQERVLAGEKFQIRTSAAKWVELTWFEMSPIERARLFGSKKDGSLLSWEQQPIPDLNTGTTLTKEYNNIRLVEGTTLLLDGGRQRASVIVRVLASQLAQHGQLRDFIETLQYQESLNPDSVED